MNRTTASPHKRKPSSIKGQTGSADSGRTGAKAKSSIRKYTRSPHGLVGKGRFLCKKHGLQAVKGYSKDAHGYFKRLGCGCHRRKNIEAARPVKKTVADITARPAAD
jgi:hypothetical protein